MPCQDLYIPALYQPWMSVTSIMACANDSFRYYKSRMKLLLYSLSLHTVLRNQHRLKLLRHAYQDLYIPALYQPWMSVTSIMACANDSFLILHITNEVADIFCVTSNGPPDPAQIETTGTHVRICTFQHFISRG